MGRFSAADDLLHDVTGRPHGRESLAFVMPLPHDGLASIVYMWVDADTGRWGRLVGLADQLSPKPLFLDIATDLELEGEDLDDCVVGGVRVRQPDPLARVELSFNAGGVTLECTMTALHEPFSWHDGAGGCFPWAADDRYEQSMRTEGSITVCGRTVEFHGGGHRDHSWGTRDWRALQHWKWMNVIAPEENLSLHGWISFALGDRQINGYVNRGGDVSPIVAAEATATLDAALMHTSVTGRFTTADGRELRLEAKAVAGLPIPARHMQMHEVACTATLDDTPAVAHIELGWPAAYVADFTTDG